MQSLTNLLAIIGVQVDHGGERLVRYRCQNNSKVASPMRFHQVPSFVMTKDENSRKNNES